MYWWTLRKLRSKDEARRAAAALELGVLGDRRALPALQAALLDPSAAVRRFALQSLAKIDGVNALDALIPTLHDTDSYVRDAAATMLIDMDDPRTAEPLALAIAGLSPDVVAETAQELFRTGERGSGLLITAIQTTPAETADRIVRALGETKSPQAVELLAAALGRREVSVRITAAKGLARVGATVASEQLVSVCADVDPGVRLIALEALMSLPNARLVELWAESGIDRLTGDISADDERLRIASARMLGKIAPPKAVDALESALKDSSPVVREVAATALGVIGDLSSVSYLAGSLADPDREVRDAAKRSLELIGGDEAKTTLASAPTETTQISYTVDEGIAHLLRAIRDDNLSPQTDFDAATERLKAAGDEAADALAVLICELLESRSAKTSTAVAAARDCAMTPNLSAALKAVVEAPELRTGSPGDSKFTPEIFGDGKIGWTSGTAARTRDLAEQVLGVPQVENIPDASPASIELVEQIRAFAAGREHATTVTETGKRVGAGAAPALRKLIAENRAGPMALAVVYAVTKWEADDAVPFIRHALGTGYPGAEYYGAIYAAGHPTPAMREMARECLASVRDEDARQMLSELVG